MGGKTSTSKLIKRKCTSCDNVWFIDPKNQDSANLNTLFSLANSFDSADEGSLSRAAAQNTSMNAATQQRLLKTCPQCGNEKYKESNFLIDTHNKSALKILSGKKKCPECAELVRTEAKKCKHCGYIYSDEEMNATSEAIQKLCDRSTELRLRKKNGQIEIAEFEKFDKGCRSFFRGCLIVIGIILTVPIISLIIIEIYRKL